MVSKWTGVLQIGGVIGTLEARPQLTGVSVVLLLPELLRVQNGAPGIGDKTRAIPYGG